MYPMVSLLWAAALCCDLRTVRPAYSTETTFGACLQVYDLFDDIFLLAGGRSLYQGAREGVEPWFRSLGFEATGKKAVADFLQARTFHASAAALIGTDPG